MAALIPNPVTLENLIDDDSDINAFNDGVKAQAVSPRTKGAEIVLVQVKDDPIADALVTGTADTDTVNTLTDSGATFLTDGVKVGDAAINTASGLSAVITVATETVLTLGTNDIFPLGTEAYKVIPKVYYEQKFGGGEWKRSGVKYGENAIVSYTLPVDGNTVTVHSVVYTWELTDIANYPAK